MPKTQFLFPSRRYYPFDSDETLGIEKRITFALDEKREYRFQGFIDRLVRARDGAIEIHDYKTSRRAATQKQVDGDRQLALYQIGLTDRFPDQPMRLVWHYLQQDRKLTSTRTPEQLRYLSEDTMSVVDRITDETEFKPKRSALCDWCEYNDRCPIYPKERLGNDRAEASSGAADSAAADPKVGSAAPDPITSQAGQLPPLQRVTLPQSSPKQSLCCSSSRSARWLPGCGSEGRSGLPRARCAGCSRLTASGRGPSCESSYPCLDQATTRPPHTTELAGFAMDLLRRRLSCETRRFAAVGEYTVSG